MLLHRINYMWVSQSCSLSFLPLWLPHFNKSPQPPIFPSFFFQSLFPLPSLPLSFQPSIPLSIRYNASSPDVLPASIRHFDSVQLSMIMYCSLNHSFLSLLPPFHVPLPVALTHAPAFFHICRSPCYERLPWKEQISVWNVEETHEKRQSHRRFTHSEKFERRVFDHFRGGLSLAAGPSSSQHRISYALSPPSP